MNLKNWNESLARACARRPWLTVGIWVVAMALAVFSMITLLGGALVTDARPTNNPESMVGLDLMNERLGIDTSKMIDEMIIVRSSTLTVDDAEFRTLVDNIFADIAALGPDVFLGGATYYMAQDSSMVSPDRHTTLIPFN